MFKSKITKEEVNQLPLMSFTGKITVVDNLEAVPHAVEKLRNANVVGIDTETKPSFARGTSHKVSLVQISTTDHCFLFRLNKIEFPDELADFLADKKIKKIGLALRDDLNGLIRQRNFKPENFIDLQAIVRNYGILELGLQKISAIIFQGKISKSQRLTNWENNELTESQMTYAATDAWASLMIYLELKKSKEITKTQLDQLLADEAMERAAIYEARNAQQV